MVVRKIIAGLLVLCFSIPFFSSIHAQVEFDQELKIVEHQEGFKLHWRTLVEGNIQYFVIERSTDGVNFVDIGSMQAQGDEVQGAEYTFFDLELGLYIAWYRLRQMDYDGSFSHTNVEREQKEQISNWRILNSELVEAEMYKFSIETIQEGSIQYDLLNEEGEIVQTRLLQLEKGINNLIIDLEFEQPGSYQAVLRFGEEELFTALQRGEGEGYDDMANKGNNPKG